MWLQMKSSNSEAYSDALFKLNASSIEYATRCWLYKLVNYCLNHVESQGNSENDDENEAAEAV